MRLNPDGTVATGWQPQGNLVAVPGAAVACAPDGQGGFYAAMLDPRSTPPGGSTDFNWDIYLQRMHGDGTVAAGWPPDGQPIAVADRWQDNLAIMPDQQGGAYLAWRDARNYNQTATDIHVQRITPNGQRALGWPVNVLLAGSLPSFQEWPRLAVDPIAGGVTIGYESLHDSRVYVQQLTAAGAYGNLAEPSGHRVTSGPTFGQERIWVAADAVGNVLAAWEDRRSDTNNADIYAKRVVTSGVTATVIALVGAEAEPDRVRLEWQAGDPVVGAVVYRSEDASSWLSLGAPRVERDRLSFEDATVVPGNRYAYRLGYRAASGEAFTAETWVDVPHAHRFALAGARPNPVVDHISVSFSLASGAPAELELFDLAGRRLAGETLGSPRPGTHTVRLMDARRVDPGVYWIRLRQGAEITRSRVVVVR